MMGQEKEGLPKRRAAPEPAHPGDDTTRAWQPREMRMVSDYLAQFYPQATSLTRVRLGSIPPAELHPLLEEHEVRMLGVFRRWADAIVITNDAMILVEAAIRPEPGDISKLQLYKRLLVHTPELQAYLPRRVEMQLVYAIEDPVVVIMAREAGIRPVYFRTKAVENYMKLLYPRERRAPRQGEI